MSNDDVSAMRGTMQSILDVLSRIEMILIHQDEGLNRLQSQLRKVRVTMSAALTEFRDELQAPRPLPSHGPIAESILEIVRRHPHPVTAGMIWRELCDAQPRGRAPAVENVYNHLRRLTDAGHVERVDHKVGRINHAYRIKGNDGNPIPETR